MAEQVVNKVAKSGIISFDIADLYHGGQREAIDLQAQLYQGMILREKDFKEYLKSTDWEYYAGKCVAVYCSEEAIIPKWAWMQLASKLTAAGAEPYFGTPAEMENRLFEWSIAEMDVSQYENAIVVVKGCGDLEIGDTAFVEITKKLQPVVRTLMFGEPCSTVPVYKKPKKR